jgi:sec-independent protein translocase protein TatB
VSLGEIVLLLIVGIVVVGPRNLPTLMRTAGQWVARIRRMSVELRSQSGIDDILRKEGLDQHLHELRSLSRAGVVADLLAPAIPPSAGAAFAQTNTASGPRPPDPPPPPPADRPRLGPLREREYPLLGCDAYGVLPDDALSYRMMAKAPKPASTPIEISSTAGASGPETTGGASS